MENTPLHHIETLRAAGFWPGEDKLDVERWLRNFDEGDKAAARVLLRSFIFVSDKVVDALLEDAYISLLGSVKANECRPADHNSIRRRQSKFIFTFPTGEKPSCTDSGYRFARKVRQLFGVEEERIVDSKEALSLLSCYNKQQIADTDLILVDDFAGTGQQLSKTLNRFDNTPKVNCSISSLAKSSGLRVHYCVLAATSQAKKALKREHSYLLLHCPHVLGNKYSIKSKNTALVPEDMRCAVIALINKYSHRYMSPDAVPKWVSMYGFNELGLTIAFEHSVPDATLPIFWAKTNSWNPLYRRA